jgi:hypothetical protein
VKLRISAHKSVSAVILKMVVLRFASKSAAERHGLLLCLITGYDESTIRKVVVRQR